MDCNNFRMATCDSPTESEIKPKEEAKIEETNSKSEESAAASKVNHAVYVEESASIAASSQDSSERKNERDSHQGSYSKIYTREDTKESPSTIPKYIIPV